MKQDAKSLGTIIAITIIIITMFYSSYIPYDHYVTKQIEAFNNITTSGPLPSGYIQPQVVDGFSEQPLEGAVIVIPELARRYKTDKNGLTIDINVPIQQDQHFDPIFPKTWGEITLIVYKEGYNDYVLFNVHVWENQGRKGPKILLIPEAEGKPSQPMTIVESPHRLWVQELVNKYKK